MTSSFTYHPEVNSNISTEKIEKLQSKVEKILQHDAVEYLNTFSNLDHRMFYYLEGSLNYWANKLSRFSYLWNQFERAKIIESFAFWNGYKNAGGILPPLEHEKKQRIKKLLKKIRFNDFSSKTKMHKVFAVIPVGSTQGTLENILKNQLQILERTELVSKIFLGFDGIDIPASVQKIIRSSTKVEVFQTPEQSGPATVRNQGLREGFSANYGDALLLDADIILEADQLNQFIKSFQTQQDLVGCPQIHSYGTRWMDQYHDINGTLNGIYATKSNTSELLFGTTSCMLLSESLKNLKPQFSEEFRTAAGEDISFCLDLRELGVPIIPYDEIHIMHWYGYNSESKNNLSIFKKRYERYGAGEVMITQKHPDYYVHLKNSAERSSISMLRQDAPE